MTTQVPLKTDLYKTEMCRKWVETGKCKYGKKCQYAHGYHELRNVVRHQKYKSKLCKNFHETGICPYGKRCNFIHNEEHDEVSSPTSSPTLIPTTIQDFVPSIHLQSPGAESLVSDSDVHEHTSEGEEEEEEEEFQLSEYKFEEESKEELVNEQYEEKYSDESEDEEFERLENEIFDLSEIATKLNLSPKESKSSSPKLGKKNLNVMSFDEIFPTFDRRLSAFSRRCPESKDDLGFNFDQFNTVIF
eukprot:gene9126-1215_t